MDGYRVELTPSEVVFRSHGGGQEAVRLRFDGGALPCRFEAEGVPARVSYLRGRDRRRWLAAIPAYPQLRCRNLYPGVDVLFYATGSHLEYDFILAPGADPARLGLRFSGMKSVHLDPAGALRIETARGAFTHHRPAAWQLGPGGRHPVKAEYRIRGPDRVEIALGPHDSGAGLVIDPVVSFSTFLGGSGAEEARGVAVDAQGNVYVAGTTQSSDFPATRPIAPPPAQFPGDVFVAKLAPDGARLLWAVYIGGSRTDVATDLAVDAAGNILVAGYTDSLDFPTTSGAFRTSAPGDGIDPDGFVLKLNAQGTGLVYSTYLGGIDVDRIHGLALDRDGSAYLAGTTASDNFPSTRGSFRSTRCAGFGLDAFLAKLNAAGSTLVYMSFLCGSSHEEALDVAVDAQGGAVAVGYSSSTDFPVTAGALGRERRSNLDGFVARLSPDGSALAYSTFLGGSADDVATSVAVDASGRMYVAGYTRSLDFPVTANAFQARQADNGLYEDGFAVLFSATGRELVGGTYLGGSAGDRVNALALDSPGVVLVAGETASADFPAAPAPCETGYGGRRDAFAARLDLERGGPPGAVFLGGRGDDEARAVAAAGGGVALVAGGTRSANFPTTQGAYSTAYRQGFRGGDAFVARVSFASSSPTPCLAHNGIVNGASFLPGPVAPGEIVSLFGAGLGPAAPVSFTVGADFTVAKELAGVRVLFDGAPAPVLAVSAGQVNAIVPYGVAGRTETRVQVEYQGRRTPEVVVPVAPAAPAIFALDASGSGPGAVLNQDYTVNSAQNPAPRGSVIQIFATGGGETRPAGVDGRVVLPEFGPIPAQALGVKVTIGGVPAAVQYAGAAPRLVAGVMQVNAVVPAGVPPGSAVPVVLEVGGMASPATVTVAVR
jgi:uncharacterized protein (TIGR03437 family)